MAVRYLPPPVAVSCPDWCTERQGHTFDERDDDGSHVRVHLRSHGEDVNANPRAYSADVVQMVRWRDEREEPMEQVGIQVWIDGDSGPRNIHSPAQARELAGYLLAAADTLESILGNAGQ